jgi:hypothetical protein
MASDSVSIPTTANGVIAELVVLALARRTLGSGRKERQP